MNKLAGMVFVSVAIGYLVTSGNWLGAAVLGAIGGGFLLRS